MRHPTVLTAVALFGAALVVPAATPAVTPAATAASTCQGVPTTPVQVDAAGTITGTEGDDVIVTAGAPRTYALGGDDLVCLTGSATDPFVDAGAGDDRVDATAVTGAVTVLGPGADRYDGSSAPDVVQAGPARGTGVDSETDVIDTGAYGGVDDEVVSGQAGAPNADRIAMQRGTLEWSGLATPDSSVTGGLYSELRLAASSADSVTVDNDAGTAAVDDQHRLAFTGFVRFRVSVAGGLRRLAFHGTVRPEEVELLLGRHPRGARHDVRLGRGNDELELRIAGTRTVPARSTYTGGTDRNDEVELVLADEAEVVLDLLRGRVTTGTGGGRATARVTGFDNAQVTAEDVELVGTDRGNALSVHACRSRVSGRGGRDQLRWKDGSDDAEPRCSGRHATFLGGHGPDVLQGSSGPDRLLGGRDQDRADGRGGRDVCEAERARRCEVRR